MNEWVKKWLPELNPAQRKLLNDKILEIIGENVDTQALVKQSRREEAKQGFAVNKRLEEIREKITGKPEEKDNRWWL